MTIRIFVDMHKMPPTTGYSRVAGIPNNMAIPSRKAGFSLSFICCVHVP